MTTVVATVDEAIIVVVAEAVAVAVEAETAAVVAEDHTGINENNTLPLIIINCCRQS